MMPTQTLALLIHHGSISKALMEFFFWIDKENKFYGQQILNVKHIFSLNVKAQCDCTVALKCKTQRQMRKHNGKTENTTTKQKTQQQNRKHNEKSENTTAKQTTTF